MDQLFEGPTVLQFETIVTLSGKVTNGPTEVSCFYAPEFSGHGSAQSLWIKDEEKTNY